jgi:anti-sigma B factor antagonist
MAPIEQLSFEPHGDFVLARVVGDVDLSNVPFVQQQLLEAVPNTATALVLDLFRTDYLDSSGVRLIFELQERLGNRGQKLGLLVARDSIVNRVLTLTEVHTVVPMSCSIDSLGLP